MNISGTLSKLFTELAWNGYQIEQGSDKASITDYVMDMLSEEIWSEGIVSKATLEELIKADPYIKQLVFNLIDWDEIASRADEYEAELEEGRLDALEWNAEYNRAGVPWGY